MRFTAASDWDGDAAGARSLPSSQRRHSVLEDPTVGFTCATCAEPVVPTALLPATIRPAPTARAAVESRPVDAAADGNPALPPLPDAPDAIAPPDPPPAPVEPEDPDEVSVAEPVGPEDPPPPLDALLLEVGLDVADPLIPPDAEAPVVDPPVVPEDALPDEPADDPPLEPPLAPVVVEAELAGVGAGGASGSEL